MFDTGGEYGNGTQRESAEAEVQQHSLFSVLLLSHKYGPVRGQMSAADVSDNPASHTKFPVVHCEVWHLFSSCFQRFQFDPNSSSQSVAWPHTRGEHLLNNVLNNNCRLTEIVWIESIKSNQAVSSKSGANTQQMFWVNPVWSSICLCSFQWFHSQDSGVTPNSSPSPTRRARYINPFSTARFVEATVWMSLLTCAFTTDQQSAQQWDGLY